MASSPENSNLLTEFEQAYEEAVATLTQEDTLYDRQHETLQYEYETKITKLTELARKLETFFSQKRFLMYSHKPEVILREDSVELKQEILKKDELIKRHYEKLAQWQALLSDMQGAPPNTSPSTAGSAQGPPPEQTMRPMQPGAPLQPGIGAPQGGFVPGNNYRNNLHQGAPGMMQGPLAYLEKTASSIGSTPPYGGNR